MPFVKFSCIGKASVSVPAMEDIAVMPDDEFTAGEDGLPVNIGKKIGLKLLPASLVNIIYKLPLWRLFVYLSVKDVSAND